MTQTISSAVATIAEELNVKVSQVETAIQLLDDGATVPFIARYRKEATAGLTDTQLRHLAERIFYLRELNDRKIVVLESIRAQEKLTPELEQRILSAETKNRLEDLYLPYRPKRRTKAQLAKEAGLEPLALALWQDPSLELESYANQFINPELGVNDIKMALDGARQILMETFSEDAELINELREYLWQNAKLKSAVKKGKQELGSKFSDYFAYEELIKQIPSHRALALFRGRREDILQFSLVLPDDEHGEKRMLAYFNVLTTPSLTSTWLLDTVRMAWKSKLFTKLELELLSRLREKADEEAIRVFSRNLHDLLLAAPAGHQITMGLDPAIRTGVKVVVVDATGKLLDYTTVYPFPPKNELHSSMVELAKLAAKYHVQIISIGNGTGSRETERLVSEMLKMYPDLGLSKIIVNEAGASVYSASELAAKEFPDLDVSLRGAVSIARRLQDPLAELVKIDPKSIGVGQYQHDVNQARLARTLDGVVEDCVNAVGVDVNTASVPLLSRISGLNETLARNVVQYRDENGAFLNRSQLKNVPRMGEKSFQQAAGFLRVMNGDNPLDASCVHPEAYPLVEKIMADQRLEMSQLIGHPERLRSINMDQYVDATYGLPTVRDVLRELEKPGRDPRPEFKTAQFKEGVEEIAHLEEGMILEGVVSNVTNFGAFVDIGVHQDGLIHVSALTDRFVRDPHAVVKAGDIVRVRVIEVDIKRRRIGLSMRLEENKASSTEKKMAKPKAPPVANKQDRSTKSKPMDLKNKKSPSPPPRMIMNTAMADALSKLKRESSHD